jgi:hypothetical protein
VLLTLFAVFAVGYLGDIPNLARGAATSMTGFGLGIIGMAILHARNGGAS